MILEKSGGARSHSTFHSPRIAADGTSSAAVSIPRIHSSQSLELLPQYKGNLVRVREELVARA